MDLASRIQALEDIEAIKRLKYDYFYYCDSKQPDGIRACFAPGIVHIDYGAIGVFDNRDALVETFTEMACHEHMIEMHHAQNPRIERVDEHNATGIWGLYYQLIDTRSNTATQLGAYYEDCYRRVDGHWLISATVCTVTSTLVCDLAGDTAGVIFAGRNRPVDACP